MDNKQLARILRNEMPVYERMMMSEGSATPFMCLMLIQRRRHGDITRLQEKEACKRIKERINYSYTLFSYLNGGAQPQVPLDVLRPTAVKFWWNWIEELEVCVLHEQNGDTTHSE